MTDRREFLRWSLLGTLASQFGSLDRLGVFDAQEGGQAAPKAAGKLQPKACIVLWMNGGPSHVDTWDPKPGTKEGGPFKAIRTSVKGIEICEHLPQVAAQMEHLAILRGMTSREGNHQRAAQLLHTGYSPNPTVAFPALGSLMAEELGDAEAELPNFVSLAGPSTGGGILGVRFNPFVVQNPLEPPQNVALWRNAGEARFARRLALLGELEAGFKGTTLDPKVDERQEVYRKAVKLMRSPRLKAFDLTTEPESLKRAYGTTPFGQGCLLARRLIENGVRCVEVTLDGWDTHKDNFGRTKTLMGTLDPAMATLVADLRQRDLLDSTLVVWIGEFGRTPVINGDEGRDHHPGAWSAVLAGGGIRGGQVVGATDSAGDKVVDAPTTVPDLYATLAATLGLDAEKTFISPSGRPIKLVDKAGKPLRQLLG